MVWVTGWPAIIGAAAVDFFPDVGTPQKRQMVAWDATTAYFEALLMRRALEEPASTHVLPNPAVLGLQALGTDKLPAMPEQKKHADPMMESGEAWIRKHDRAVRSAQHLLRSPQQGPQETTSSPSVPLSERLEARRRRSFYTATSEEQDASPQPDGPSSVGHGDLVQAPRDHTPETPILCDCGMSFLQVSGYCQVYGAEKCAVCDMCFEPCTFATSWHCKQCLFDLCSVNVFTE